MPTPMKVFERLNALSHLTPDEIAQKITPVTWVRGKDITAELRDEWQNKRIRIAYEPLGGGDVILTGDGPYNGYSFSLHGYHGSLQDYWFITEENFHGQLPDRAS